MLKKINLTEKLSKLYISHIMTIMIAIFSIGYRGKTVNFETHSVHHRTTIAHFLNKGKWDETIVENILKEEVRKLIYKEAQCTGKPVYLIIDDTISSKTKPSSKAKHPIEDAYFHFSHLKKKSDYGHQAIAVMLSCNGITLNYAIIMYDKSVSKIELICRIASELPVAPVVSYLLCDSWYVCDKVINSFISKGFYTIGALKTNRIIYPHGIKCNVSSFASALKESAMPFHIVTVKKRKYNIFRYEGNLNGIDNAVVLISFPVDTMDNPNTLRAFISTDVSLSSEEILNVYVNRWAIEVFFRDCKTKLAFDGYQIRSRKGIRRFWIITSLAYFIACSQSKSFHFWGMGGSLTLFVVRKIGLIHTAYLIFFKLQPMLQVFLHVKGVALDNLLKIQAVRATIKDSRIPFDGAALLSFTQCHRLGDTAYLSFLIFHFPDLLVDINRPPVRHWSVSYRHVPAGGSAR